MRVTIASIHGRKKMLERMRARAGACVRECVVYFTSFLVSEVSVKCQRSEVKVPLINFILFEWLFQSSATIRLGRKWLFVALPVQAEGQWKPL